ncbi:MAG: serine/threonine protein kinase [Polyangiaceae bacterium]|jgi:serine/threonine-protein kinase|nr:serine/threonine protein kinase [Polyangiaceae bacterium]
MTNAEREDLLPDGSLLGGRYRVLRKLGPTTMGAVVAAEDTRSGEQVALKVIWPSYLEALGDALLKRFVREAHVSAALPSPHIVPVLSGAIDPSTRIPYIVMPLLQGRDLDAWLRDRSPLAPEIAVRIALQAGQGLKLAHEYGIVHRDIKPSNIFLEEKDDELVVRVSDFGVAKIKPVDEQHITRTGSLLGSPVYMAPEQMIRPKDVDPRADVWSLAMTLFHALAGQAPLARCKSFADLVLALSQHPIPSLQELAPWVGKDLARAVHGALLRDLDARCPSIDAFLEAIAPFAGGTTRLTPADLAPLGEQQRAKKQERGPLPSRWELGPLSSEAPTIPRDSSLLGKTIGGRFVLKTLLHEGPAATLYAAEEGPARVAVKLFHREISERRAWFEAYGARLEKVQKVKNEQIVRVLAHGFDEGLNQYFVATELLAGQDLGSMIRSRGQLHPGAVARALVQVGQALSAAHAAGVLHENIKPSNIFLQDQGDGRVVARLCDFGQPCPLEHREGEDGPAFSVAGRFALSPMYLAPEQVQGKPATMRSDLWSLALVLYEALAGRKPWQGYHSLGELLLAIQHEEIRSIREIAPWIEGGLAEAIHDGLRRDPARRYSSIRDLIMALGPFAASVPSLQLSSFSTSRPNVVIQQDKDVSALEKTALADSSNTHPPAPLPRLPSTPPRPAAPLPSATMLSSGDEPSAAPRGVLFAVIAALLVVAATAAFLLK